MKGQKVPRRLEPLQTAKYPTIDNSNIKSAFTENLSLMKDNGNVRGQRQHSTFNPKDSYHTDKHFAAFPQHKNPLKTNNISHVISCNQHQIDNNVQNEPHIPFTSRLETKKILTRDDLLTTTQESEIAVENSPGPAAENGPVTLQTLLDCCNNVTKTQTCQDRGKKTPQAGTETTISDTNALQDPCFVANNSLGKNLSLLKCSGSQNMTNKTWRPYSHICLQEESSDLSKITRHNSNSEKASELDCDKSLVSRSQVKSDRDVNDESVFEVSTGNNDISKQTNERDICESYQSVSAISPDEKAVSMGENSDDHLLHCSFPMTKYYSDHEINVNDIIIDISLCIDHDSLITLDEETNRTRQSCSKTVCLSSTKSKPTLKDGDKRLNSKTRELDLTVEGSTIGKNASTIQMKDFNNNKTFIEEPQSGIKAPDSGDLESLDIPGESELKKTTSPTKRGDQLYEKFRRAKMNLKSAMDDTKKAYDISNQSKYINMDTSMKATHLASEINARSEITNIVKAAVRQRLVLGVESVQKVAYGQEVIDRQFFYNQDGAPTKSTHIYAEVDTFAKGAAQPLAIFLSDDMRRKNLLKSGEKIAKFSRDLTGQSQSQQVRPTCVKTIIQKNDRDIVAFPEALGLEDVPVSSLRVQWRIYHSQASPSLPQVFALLNRIIQCLCVVRVSANCACATFLNSAHAQHVLRSLTPMQGPRLLIVSWWWGEAASRRCADWCSRTSAVEWLVQQYKDLVLCRKQFYNQSLIAKQRRNMHNPMVTNRTTPLVQRQESNPQEYMQKRLESLTVKLKKVMH